MVKFYKKSVVTFFSVLFLLFISGILLYYQNSLTDSFLKVIITLVRDFIFYSLLFIWIGSFKERIVNKDIQNILIQIGIFSIFWIFIRSIRGNFLLSASFLNRICWYMFYIPVIFIAYLFIKLSFYLNKIDNKKQINKKLRFLKIICFTLTFIVLTNDFSNLVIKFNEGLDNYLINYSYNVFFYIITLFFIIAGFILVFTLFKNSKGTINKFCLITSITFYVLLVLIYILHTTKICFFDLNISAICFIIILIESIIYSGVIRTNLNILDFSKISSLRENKVKNNIDNVLFLKREEYNKNQQTKNELINEFNTLDDKAFIDEIYEKINHEAINDLNNFKSYLYQDFDNKEQFDFKKLIVKGSFIKRKINLILLGIKNKYIDLNELVLCFNESLRNLSLKGVKYNINILTTGQIKINKALSLYDYFEKLIEDETLNIKTLNIDIKRKNNDLIIIYHLEGVKKDSTENKLINKDILFLKNNEDKDTNIKLMITGALT